MTHESAVPRPRPAPVSDRQILFSLASVAVHATRTALMAATAAAAGLATGAAVVALIEGWPMLPFLAGIAAAVVLAVGTVTLSLVAPRLVAVIVDEVTR